MPFRRKVDILRTKELKSLKALATVRSILSIVFSSVTLLMALCTFSVFSTVGGPGMTPGKMTPEVIFVSMTLFGIMNRPLGQLSFVISRTIAIVVAMQRVQRYLLLEEIDTTAVQRYRRHQGQNQNHNDGTNSLAIEIKDATLAWHKKDEEDETASSAAVEEDVSVLSASAERQPLLTADRTQHHHHHHHHEHGGLAEPVLSDINLKIKEGKIAAIVGRIGQGKTSLLSSIMGETYKQKGSLTVWGSLAYVPQQVSDAFEYQ
jgi:ABC-type multidrug transport system fused ATPase/permease subunit